MVEWREIGGYEGKYEVSDQGDVRNARSGRILKTRVHRTGHPVLNLCDHAEKKTYQVSRLVADAFLEHRTALKSVNHKNGDLTDNRACNLEWAGIPIDTLRDEYEHQGLTTYQIAKLHGYKDHKPVLRQLTAAGIPRRDLMEQFQADGDRRKAEAVALFRDEFPEAGDAVASNRWARHNYRKENRERDEGINWRTVGQRDGWICGICGEKVANTDGFSPDAPTVDHIIPIIDGGTDTWDNVQLAHVRCNCMKGRKTLAEAREIMNCS